MVEFKQNRIKELRKERGWTLLLLAEKAGTSQQQIYKLENAHRGLDPAWIYKLCQAFEVRPDQLVPCFKGLYTKRQTELLEKLDALARKEREILDAIDQEVPAIR